MGTTSASRADAATTITVNTTSDETVTDGQCSLREAINNANANADTTGGDCLAGSLGVDTIDISSLSGTILLSIPNDFGRSTLPTITDALTITGPGSSALTIKQTGLGRVMTIGGGVPAAISGITITDGNGQGAGIFVAGTLALSKSTVTGNNGGPGGGIFVNGIGTLTLLNSTVSNNNAAGSVGGGVANENGTLTINNSTISGNTASQGGGIYSDHALSVSNSTVRDNSALDAFSNAFGGGIANAAGTASVTNSTVTGNTAGGAFADGGGIIDFGSLTATNDTITGNGASGTNSGFGGGVVSSGSTVLANTIVAGQTAGGDCSGFPIDSGYNLAGDGSCGFSSTNNSLSNTNPLLDPAGLQDNGGPTQTISLQPGSPAIDAIPSGVNACGTTITTDQRGVNRPQGTACDIGAFEFVAPSGADLAITKSASPNTVVSGNRLTYTLTVNNNGPQNATGVTVTDPLPGSVHFDSVTPSQGTCVRSPTANPQPKGGTVTCSLGDLANGVSTRITIVATATTPGTLTNTANSERKRNRPESRQQHRDCDYHRHRDLTNTRSDLYVRPGDTPGRTVCAGQPRQPLVVVQVI